MKKKIRISGDRLCYIMLLILSIVFMFVEGDATAFVFLVILGGYLLVEKIRVKQTSDKSSRDLHGL